VQIICDDCRGISPHIAQAQRSQRRTRATRRRHPLAVIAADFQRLVRATPWEQLAHLPRYLQAMQRRLEKYPRDPERDAKHAASIADWWKRYEERLEKQRKAGAVDPQFETFRWQLEELRVSLYAQELKTPYPVSYKRIEKFWNALR
jgi:ATP-dependent helicase HrpA